MSSQVSSGPSIGESDDGGDRGEKPPESLSRDTAFHLVQNGRRRAVLRYLFDHEERDQISMRKIAEVVAAWDHNKSIEELRSDERQRVYIALYQSHLPKLADHGVIDYDRSRGTIALQRLAYALLPLLEEGLHAPQTLHVDDLPTEDESGKGLLSRFGL